MEEGGTSNSPSYQTTDETFQINLIEHNLSEDTDTESERDVVICVVDDVAHFNDTEKQGLAFKHGLEGYVLCIRTDIRDTDSVQFKLSQDDGSCELVSDYKIVLSYGSSNTIIYHIANMVIDNLQPGPTVVHIDTGATYKCRAGVVRSHYDEDVIVHTNIQKLPDATMCKIIFGDNLEVPCSKIRTHQNTEYTSLIVKSAEIPNSVNLLTLDQWIKQLNIPQLCGDQDNYSYQYSDKCSGEKFWTNLINNGNDDAIDSLSNKMVMGIKTTVPNFEINYREGLAFKSGSHGYVSAKAKIHDIDNVCFKLCNDDGSDELITDHKIILKCGWRNMDIYYIPNLIIYNLQTGPTIVHIDTGEIYKYRAGVVQSQVDEHYIVHANINHLPDVSKCKIIFDDKSTVSCCGITNYQQCSSLLMKIVEIPASINVVTVDQWVQQLHRKQVSLRMDDQEQSAVVQDTASIKSKERGPMTGEDQRRMEEAKLKLIDGISDPQPICDYLVDEDILLSEDKDAIDMVDRPTKKTIKLLNLIIKEYKGSFPVFVRALKETHHYSLAKLLEDGLEGENFVQTIAKDINKSELVTAQNMATYKPVGAKPADQRWPNQERQEEIIGEDKDFIIKQLETHIASGNINEVETLLKQLQSSDIRRLRCDFVKLTNKTIAKGNLPLLHCLFINCLMLQSDISLGLELLTCAIKYDYVEGIKYLYSQGYTLQIRHEDKLWSALTESVRFNSLKAVEYILSITDTNLKPDPDYSILMFAKSGEMLSILLSNDSIKRMIDYKSVEGYTALYYCIKNADNTSDCVNCINVLTEAGLDSKRSLHYVIQHHSDNIDTCIQVVSSLVKHGADIHRGDRDGLTLLTCAIRYHGNNIDTCIKLVSSLIEHGADIHGRDRDGDTPLTCAIRYHGDNIDTCIQLVSSLIEHGADITIVNGNGDTPLACVIRYYGDNIDTCIKLVSSLIEHGANVNKLAWYGGTPLIPAIRYRGDNIDTCIKLVSSLIEHGADANGVKRGGCIPLTYAILYHGCNIDTCIKLISLLIEHGADVNGVDGNGCAPLICAIKYNGDCRRRFAYITCLSDVRHHGNNIDTRIKLISFLIKHGADVNGVDRGGVTPLTCAIRYHVDNIDTCIKLLIQYGADVTGLGMYDEAPITCVILSHGDNIDTCIKLMLLLIEHGADVNELGRYDETPLTCVIQYYVHNIDTCIKLMLLLIEHGADVNELGRYDETPLTCAMRYYGHNINACIKLIPLLIQHGADIRKKGKLGITPLMHAGQLALQPEVVKLLLGDEDNVNSTDGDGLSA